MFKSKVKPTPPKRERKPNDLGLFGISDDLNLDDDNDMDDNDGDSDLEAELAAITSGGGSRRTKKPKPKIVPPAQLDALIADSLKDIPSDEDLSEGDENDPELLGELAEIAGSENEDVSESKMDTAEQPPVIVPTTPTNIIDLIKSRIQMYTTAEANAKQAGDSSRARRFNRGLKTLKDLQKQAEKGKTIDPSEIPPEVAVKPKAPSSTNNEQSVEEPPSSPPPVPARRAPAPPPDMPAPILPTTSETEKVTVEDPRLAVLKVRKNEFQLAALTAKKAGDTATAIKYVKIVKQFEKVMEALVNGQEVDLSNMPTLEKPKEKEENEVQQKSSVQEKQEEPLPQETLITANSVIEALEQRLAKYQSQEKAAKDEGNSSKARRMGRICKQYQDAIKLHKLGKPVAFDELPTPPGYAPIPGTAPKTPTIPQAQPIPSSSGTDENTSQKKTPPQPSSIPQEKEQTRVSGSCKNTTLMDKQIAFLLERQREFKQAAIDAKKANEIEQAKEYLRIYKGLDNLLETARGGFPIDMATVPIPPSKRAALEDGFTFVTQDECVEGDLGDIRIRLEEQLCKQLMMCKNTRDHHKAMGDVAGTNRFENLALATQKDLDFIRLAHKKGLPLPKFHYEKKSFNIVKCNTDLSDNELEISIVRGINYSVSNPKDVDTYVKVEFPWPQDDPFKAKTTVIKDSDNPEYNQKYSVEIQRNSKACQRIFKRQQVKCEIYSKGGFLRSDTLIGKVDIKVQPLETNCDIHDSFPIMDGRKQTGGKLEVKIRVRNPILTKQMEQINEKWVVIDA